MKRETKFICILLCLILGCMTILTGCKKEETPEPTVTPGGDEVEGKKAILVVSFGTSYNNSRDITIGGIENAIQKAYPDIEVRRAFTSQIIIDILKDRENLEIDNVEQALERAVQDGITELYVQPTHLMNGFEYTDLKDALANYEDKIEKIALGEPLLTSDEDFEKVASQLVAKTADYDDGETAIVYMGHGTEADSNSVYGKMQEVLTADGNENYYIGTVEAEPSLDDIISSLKEKEYKKVVLLPMMVVSGDHANNDMAGDEEDSWKSILTGEGYEVTCILEGLGQDEVIQQIYVDHVKAIVEYEHIK